MATITINLPWTIREAKVTDARVLSEIAVGIFGQSANDRVREAVLEHAESDFRLSDIPKRSIGSKYFVAVDAHDLAFGMIGLYKFRWIGPHVAYLGWFFLDPRRQGQGIGKEMLKHVIEVARQAKLEILFVETSDKPTATVQFYVSQGFRFQARVPAYWPDRSDLLLMSRQITP